MSLAAIEVYASTFDGWGAWSTAPLFLVPALLSLVIAGAGAAQCLSEARAGGVRSASIAFTVVAALPIAWLVIRRHFL